MTVQDRWYHAKRRVREFVEDEWFDRTHHVHTMGDMALRDAGIADTDRADSELYVPARPANIRTALQAAPIQDASLYTFVDFGSGKGRALFVAAEMPFRRVIGVEFSAPLHAEACRNAHSFRYHGKDGSCVEPIHQNAMRFEFPSGPLVLYLFNPSVRRQCRSYSIHWQSRSCATRAMWSSFCCGHVVATRWHTFQACAAFAQQGGMRSSRPALRRDECATVPGLSRGGIPWR